MRDVVILFCSFDRHRRPASTARRPPVRGGRVGARQTSTADPQSRPQACTQPARRGSYARRFVHSFHAPNTHPPFRHCSEDFYSALSPQRAEKTKVLLVDGELQNWPKARWSNNVTEGNGRPVFKGDLEFAMDMYDSDRINVPACLPYAA